MSLNYGNYRFRAGFSLVEMAIVLLVLGIALGGLLGAVGQSAENTRRIEAKNTLREIEESLYAFAQVQGRLPCPADDDDFGVEAVTDTASGTCERYHGLLPNATLGLSGTIDANGFLQDPWGNAYRYSVSENTPITDSKYTGINGIQDIYGPPADVGSGPDTLQVCEDTGCAGILTNIAPAVVLSMGSNWASVGTGSAEEQANGSGATTTGGTYTVTNSNTFVVTGYSELNFDDMLVWLSPHLLFGKMIQAGKLP